MKKAAKILSIMLVVLLIGSFSMQKLFAQEDGKEPCPWPCDVIAWVYTQLMEHIQDSSMHRSARYFDFRTSSSSPTEVDAENVKFCYGHVSVNGLQSVTISNLPFSGPSTYSASGSYNLSIPDVIARVQIERLTGNHMKITNAHPDVREINWMAVGY